MPWKVVKSGMAQAGAILPAGSTTAFAMMLVDMGDARWSARLARGPLPVTCAAMMMPAKASIARRPFLISFNLASENALGSLAIPEERDEAL